VKMDRIVIGVLVSALLGAMAPALAGQEPTVGMSARRSASAPVAVQQVSCAPQQHSFWFFDWYSTPKDASCVTVNVPVSGAAPLVLGTGY
jgi:hypothetical protein